MGKKFVDMIGRNEFEYNFYIVNDENFNVFVLLGG